MRNLSNKTDDKDKSDLNKEALKSEYVLIILKAVNRIIRPSLRHNDLET